MAIAFRNGIGSNNAGGAISITMTVPTGVVNGDVLVMMVCSDSNSGSSGPLTPTGWSLLSSTLNSGSLTCRTYWRIASSEPASYSVSLASGVPKASGVMIALSGADSSTPVAAQFSSQGNASSITCIAPALGSWSSVNGIDLYFATWHVGGDTLTSIAPTNYTNAGSSASTGGSAASRTQSIGAYRSLSAVTTVGSLTANDTTAAANIGSHVFIKELNAFTFQQLTPIENPIFEPLGVVSYMKLLFGMLNDLLTNFYGA